MTQNPPIPILLITGAGGHIGRAFAMAAALSARLILVDKDAGALHEAAAELPMQDTHGYDVIACDLAVEDDRHELIAEVKKNHPGLNGLINNAAFTGDSNLQGWAVPFEEQSLEAWRTAFEVNLTAAFHLSQGLSPVLKKNHNGHILNIGSIYGGLGPDMRLYKGTDMGNPAAYAASKGGMIELTRWLATVLAPHVRVNCVSPGGVLRGQSETFIKAYEARTPLGRMAREDDIIGAMMFLTLGQSQYITGQNLLVDGGFSIW